MPIITHSALSTVLKKTPPEGGLAGSEFRSEKVNALMEGGAER